MIDGQFIQVKTKDNFLTALENEEINDSSIAFIEDTNEIWAKNKYYKAVPDGGTDGQVLSTDGTLLKWSTVESSGVTLNNIDDLNCQLLFGGKAVIDWKMHRLYNPDLVMPDNYTVDWVNEKLYTLSSSQMLRIDWKNGLLVDGIYQNVDWVNRHLNTYTQKSIDWGSRQAWTSSNFASIDWENKILLNAASNATIDWGSGVLYDTLGDPTFDWNNRELYSSSQNSIIVFDDTSINIINNNTVLEIGANIDITSTSSIVARAGNNSDISFTTYGTGKMSYNGKEVATVDQIGGGSSVSVVQSTGQSTTEVMSQKAVTDQLNNKAGTSIATTSSDGLMSASDKQLLNSLSTSSNTFNIDFGVISNAEAQLKNLSIEEYLIPILNRIQYPSCPANPFGTYNEVDAEWLIDLYVQLKEGDDTKVRQITSDITTFTSVADKKATGDTSIHQTLLSYFSEYLLMNGGDGNSVQSVNLSNFPVVTITIKRFWADFYQFLGYEDYSGISVKNGYIIYDIDDENRKMYMAEITYDIPYLMDSFDPNPAWATHLQTNDCEENAIDFPKKMICCIKFDNISNGDPSSSSYFLQYVPIASSEIRAWGGINNTIPESEQ